MTLYDAIIYLEQKKPKTADCLLQFEIFLEKFLAIWGQKRNFKAGLGNDRLTA